MDSSDPEQESEHLDSRLSLSAFLLCDRGLLASPLWASFSAGEAQLPPGDSCMGILQAGGPVAHSDVTQSREVPLCPGAPPTPQPLSP